jgi:NADPH-dependent 2,4-dienoyl-CoA reductase/sulfur reductase-like enzyme
LIARTKEEFEESGVHVMLNTRVEQVDTEKGEVRLSNNEIMPYDHLVMGTGANIFLPPVPGLDLEGVFTLKNLSDAIRIKSYIRENSCKKAIILGAGFIALEMSEGFRKRGLETTIVYRGELPVSMWDPELSGMILEELINNHVSFLSHRSPVAIERGNNSSLRLMTDDGELESDIILIALGIRPNVKLAHETGLEIGKTGAVVVDFSQRTSREGIYAVGDCCEVFHRISKTWTHIPLGDIANKQGRVAGHTIGGVPMTFPGVVGAQSFKVFNLEVAKTGLDEEGAAKSDYHPVSTIIEGTPISRPLGKDEKVILKLIADRYSGKLLGAQAVGQSGAVSRINTLSACLWSEMGLDEIGYMDLAYSPYFGGGWDAIQIAAQHLKKTML